MLDNWAKSHYHMRTLGEKASQNQGGGDRSLFPHLYAMKESHHLSADDMGAIIGKSRQTYLYKAQYGSFTPVECKALCRHFHKSFEYLFATNDDVDRIDAYFTGMMSKTSEADHAGADDTDHTDGQGE